MKELKRQLRREVLGDLRPILEASGIQFSNIGAVMSDEERRSNLASIVAGGERSHEDLQAPASGPSIKLDTIDNLAQPTVCSLMLLVGRYRMEVGRGIVYPCQTMLNDIQINTSSYVVVKVDMVHDKSKDLKLEVPPDDTTLTMRDAVVRRVQWRRTSIDIDPAAAASSLTSPASMSPEAHLSPSPNSEQLVLSTIREQLPPIIEKSQKSQIQDQPHPSPILELSQKSPLKEQLRRSPPHTRSTPLTTHDQPQPKATKNVRGKSHPQQRKMSSKETKGKKSLKESEANLKFQMGSRC
jgi:hypothetical protein